MSALADRNTNVSATSDPTMHDKQEPASGEENIPQQGEQQHKSVAAQKSSTSDGQNGNYISPSDVLSPASQKLVGFKQRQINRQGNKNPAARTLFARTASASSGGFDDVETTEKKT